jgi:2Fe-2S ferredoxin
MCSCLDECMGGDWPTCISCHVIIPEEFHNSLIAPTYDEVNTIEAAPGLSRHSRLACQIIIDEHTVDGMVVSIPERVKSYTVDAWCRQ